MFFKYLTKNQKYKPGTCGIKEPFGNCWAASKLLLFDAKPELGEDNVRDAIKEYLKTTDILHAETSFYGTNERELVENPGYIVYAYNLQ